MSAAKLYSWVDVDARLESLRLRGDWPKGLGRASAYYDGVLLNLREAAVLPGVTAWLEQHFHERYQAEPESALLLEAPVGQQRKLPLQFEILEEAPNDLPLPVTPSWKRLALLPTDSEERPQITINHPPSLPLGTPPLVAFYSFKGGVGRTVHLSALLREMSERKLRALIIDADLEAPGLSVLAEKDGWGLPEIALVDLLALAHGEPVAGWPETLTLCAERLRSQPLRVGAIEHFFLATYRNEEQSLRLDVRPEHLTQTPQTAWHLGELFAALGRELKVDAVLIDLRAGLSELASSLLFDARLHRVLVTTAGVQAREGTRLVLEQLGKLLPPLGREDLFDPEVLLSMLNPERLENVEKLTELRDELEDAYPTTPIDDHTVTWRVDINELHQTKFYDSLLNVESLSDLLERIRGCGLAAQFHDLVEREWKTWLLPPPPKVISPTPDFSLSQAKKDRQALFDSAKRLEYAEDMGISNDFLATAPLRALAQRFEVQPPLAIVLGQKGAGKTFLFLRIVASGLWTAFVEQTLKRRTAAKRPCLAWPLGWSRQLGEKAQGAIKSSAARSRTAVHAPWGDRTEWNLSMLQDRVAKALKQGSTKEADWREFWFSLLAESLGIAPTDGVEPVRAVVQLVRDGGVQLAVLVDGLEELFPNVRANEVEQVALRGLLQGVPERLREIPDPPLGFLVVVRHDVAAAAVRQNFGQFERSYEPFLLRWSAEEALRLALWLAREDAKVSVLPPLTEPIEQLDGNKIREALYGLWGYKLGPPSSREARSAEYVLSALADFQGRVQARDMVRLIQRATVLSQKSKEAKPLLVPRSVREALDFCGQEKLRELLEEIANLKQPIERLRSGGKAKDRRSPFDPKSFDLSAEDVQLLEVTGLVKKDGERYWLSELLRRGLDFSMREGRRPRIVNL